MKLEKYVKLKNGDVLQVGENGLLMFDVPNCDFTMGDAPFRYVYVGEEILEGEETSLIPANMIDRVSPEIWPLMDTGWLAVWRDQSKSSLVYTSEISGLSHKHDVLTGITMQYNNQVKAEDILELYLPKNKNGIRIGFELIYRKAQ